MSLKTYHGSCHCGTVQFEADIDLSVGTTRCNCSFCSKARSWFAYALPQHFRLLWGEDAQIEYLWTPIGQPAPHLHYHFCRVCGINTPGLGEHGPDRTPFYFIPVALLDGVDPDELAASIHYVDGRHGRFDRPPDDTRLL
jgi:hypothetical protein